MKFRLILVVASLFSLSTFAQESKEYVYKKVDTISLKLEILYPDNKTIEKQYPVIIFFFGGGWNGGTIEQFRPQAEYLTSRNMVAILADYRVKSKHNASPFEALSDAKSAIRYLRENAGKLHINPDKIVASGGSAGGHLAAATALIKAYDDTSDDLTVSCIPNALVLFNPVVDNGPAGYGYERIGEEFTTFSPLHNIRSGAPPTLFLLGTKDQLVPVETGRYFQKALEWTGNKCVLKLYEGGEHGFFNPRNRSFYFSTLRETESFLDSLGYTGDIVSRPVIDTVGFAWRDMQMDSIVSRLNERVGDINEEEWLAAIAPHDDYKYAGEVTLSTLTGVKAKTVILFGVAHKAKTFGLEDKLVFGSFSHWDAPYGRIPVSQMRDEILKRLPDDEWLVHDSMMMAEQSLEALNPFLQRQNVGLQIIPVLVPYMSYDRMTEISQNLSSVIMEIMKERGMEFGKDIAIVISNDAVHYGDLEWGGKDMAPYGSDEEGNRKALSYEKEIIDNSLVGDISIKKIKKFVNYTVQKSDYHEYKWTWCGRYSIPLGLMTANKISASLLGKPLSGQLLHYATSIDHDLFPVEDLGMGVTAPANSRHWVGYVGIGYK